MRRAAWVGLACVVLAVLGGTGLYGCRPGPGSESEPTPASTEAQAQPTGPTTRVHGEVFDPEGRPAAGCEVLIFHHGRADERRLTRTASGPDGTFDTTVEVLEPRRPVYVVARREGFALDAQGVERDSPALLQLGAKPERLAGRVVDAGGAPVEGAKVILRRLPRSAGLVEWDEHPQNPFVTHTDAAGRFAITGLSTTLDLSLVATADGHGRRTVHIGKKTDPEHVTIPLRPESLLSGMVVHDGEPVAGVRVGCIQEHGTEGGGEDNTVTGDDGTYTLRHLWFGAFNVYFEPPEGCVALAIEDVQVAESEHRKLGKTRLTEGGIVRGRVTEAETGEPVPNIRVWAYGPARPRYTGTRTPAITDADGRYEARLAAGENEIRVRGQAYPGIYDRIDGQDRQTVQLAEGQTVEGVDFQLKGREVKPLGPGPLEMSVELIPEDGTISADEPLIAKVLLTNTGTEPVNVTKSGTLTWRLQVRDMDGNLVAITPRELLPMDFMAYGQQVEPGEADTTPMVVSALHTFSEPGEYEVRVQRQLLTEHFPVLDEASATVTVLPFDEERLVERCRELLDKRDAVAPDGSWFRGICSVRHAAAAPVLIEAARQYPRSETFRALREVGTPEAMTALAEHAARTDHAGKAARSIQDEPPRHKHRWPPGIM